MDSSDGEKEQVDRRNGNTEYIPTKCRVTKPPPPKPATNPLQFIKVAPCPLYQKANEQIKKVEEIKRERKEIREEAEDWQANLDNWKSSRRKRQEHIIERVVEVKKIEQEEKERTRRKNKTFSEMMEDRSKGRHKFSIPSFDDDDSNDFSDYGIRSSSPKSNSNKDPDTDESSSILDEKDQSMYILSPKEQENATNNNLNQSQSEDNQSITTQSNQSMVKSYSNTLYNNPITKNITSTNDCYMQSEINQNEPNTFEGAIEGYRSRIKARIGESVFSKQPADLSPTKELKPQTNLPKGEIFKRKELFDKPVEIRHYESNSTLRLSEVFVNTESIKQRLLNLEKCTDQPVKLVDKSTLGSVKQKLQMFNNAKEDRNGNSDIKTQPNKISIYLVDRPNNNSITETKNTQNTMDWKKEETSDRSSSPEADLYMDKLNMFERELDTLYTKSSNSFDHTSEESNYPPSTSSAELMGLSSDREDSGIHTADVSCSVSQADEPVEDTELAATTIPSCIEKLNKEQELLKIQELQKTNELNCINNNNAENEFSSNDNTFISTISLDKQNEPESSTVPNVVGFLTKDDVIHKTIEFLDSIRRDASENLEVSKQIKPKNIKEVKPINFEVKSIVMQPTSKEFKTDILAIAGTSTSSNIEKTFFKQPSIYENIDFNPLVLPDDLASDSFLFECEVPLGPSKVLEPPKVKPPPPPLEEEEEKPKSSSIKRLNSTKRIKKEILLKRSSFLGLSEPSDYQIDPDLVLEKPPDVNMFLQKEVKLEKSIYKKMQEDRMGVLSKVESQDSGLDIDRGRLSSDTWSSTTTMHDRQDSEEQTNSFTSEEDEITKKEREIIELVEKEEKSRDVDSTVKDFVETTLLPQRKQNSNVSVLEPTLGSEKFDQPYFPSQSSDFLDEQDSEVLKVEQELLELEKEELKRKNDNMFFRESCTRARMKTNRHSLENICDDVYAPFHENVDHRKSMPELLLMPLDGRKSTAEAPNTYNIYNNVDVELQYRQSMPNIQQAYQKSLTEYRKPLPKNEAQHIDHRKSMPDLQSEMNKTGYQNLTSASKVQQHAAVFNESKDIFKLHNPVPSNALHHNGKLSRPLTRNSIQALSAAPRNRHIPNDNWIQLRSNPEIKNYNQHWVYQEAELRRIQDQQKNMQHSRNRTSNRQDKPLPDSVIQTLTQRVQNRINISDRSPPALMRRSSNSPNNSQHPLMGHSPSLGHASPLAYPPGAAAKDDNQDRVLSVSGKKKCSYCGNELGRGAAMIIESLCLFYHVECFKCCVCHVQLGDGLMGTDVRVRNQKLHCHNCYSSDDGVKFSCV